MKKIILTTMVTSLVINLIMTGGMIMANTYVYDDAKCKHEAFKKEDIKDLFIEVTGTITLNNTDTATKEIAYPEGCNQLNTYVISAMSTRTANTALNNYVFGFVPNGNFTPRVTLKTDTIEIYYLMTNATTATFKYKILLMKSLNS